MNENVKTDRPFWYPDARGWLSIAMFLLTLAILIAITFKPELAENEFFKVLASAIVVTGLLNNVTGFYFTASKANADMRDQVNKALTVADQAQTVAATVLPTPEPEATPVKIVQPADEPVPVQEAETPPEWPLGAPAEGKGVDPEVPSYARP